MPTASQKAGNALARAMRDAIDITTKNTGLSRRAAFEELTLVMRDAFESAEYFEPVSAPVEELIWVRDGKKIGSYIVAQNARVRPAPDGLRALRGMFKVMIYG